MPTFRTQSTLWYNTGIWGKLGFGVANFGQNPTTENSGIAYLVDALGKALFGVLNTPDTDLTIAPSVNTLSRINKLIIRARSILASRAVPSGTPNMEGIHTDPDQIDFTLYPCPYFLIRNRWLREYSGLVLASLAEAMQHTENRKQYDFSVDFAQVVGQYLQRIYVRMAVELLLQDATKAADQNFVITEAMLATYSPSSFLTSTESVDTAPPNPLEPSAYDMQFLASGIPAKNVVGLCLWPNGDVIPQGVPDQQLTPNPPGAIDGSDTTAAAAGQAAAGAAGAAPSVAPFPGAPSP